MFEQRKARTQFIKVDGATTVARGGKHAGDHLNFWQKRARGNEKPLSREALANALELANRQLPKVSRQIATKVG